MPGEPIAIVGSSCRFAGGANSPSKLWELLREPRDVRSEIPETRFNPKGFYHPNNSYHGHSNVMHSYLLDQDVSTFDAEFFGVKPVEAKAIDPQQRLLMETVYEGLEAAGMSIQSLRGSDTSVYVGVMCNDYEALQLRDLQTIPTYFATGVGRSILSNRISYFFDWHGPSITIDTACSSSLIAIHMGVQALRSGESRTALACGANLILGPENFIIESKLKMLSPNGYSKMWDRDADGYARGDGVAVVVLKGLSAALADGDNIECIIRETGVNQDGATQGITMPSATAQEALIRSTYAKAGLDLLSAAGRPQYFEAHGTGTPAGDPIEAEAIRNAFFQGYHDIQPGDDPLYVGSIKTILGHTEGTAGVAAVLKASLALQHDCIPPNLLFDNLSDSVAPFYKDLEIRKTATPWPSVPEGMPKRASVNSFGFGGANAHAILESYRKPAEPTVKSKDERIFSPFVFSTLSERTMRATLIAFQGYLKASTISASDLAWTLRERRSVLPYRVALTASSIEELESKIATKLEDSSKSVGTKCFPTSKTENCKILGVFTGQGAQYARMGAELIEKAPKALSIVQELESHLARLPEQDRPSWSLQAELLASSTSSRIAEASISQPLCTAVQIILVDLLRIAKVELHAAVGHSSGEIAAAYAAGFLSARDAICIAYYRGLHVKEASSPNGDHIKGAMLAAGTSWEDATEICQSAEFSGRIAVAASNSSSSVTFSGDEDAISELQEILEDEKKFNRKLRVDKAYHSRHMLACFDPYVDSVQRAGVKATETSSKCTWFSSVFNRPVETTEGLSDVYWAENMTSPVLFSQALTLALSTQDIGIVIEIGPHAALKGPASQTVEEILGKTIPYHATLSRGVDAVSAMSDSLGFLWTLLDKTFVDLESYESAVGVEGRRFELIKDLPTYQWDHETRHWHESRRSMKMRTSNRSVHSLLGDMTPDSSPHHLMWKNLLRVSEIDWLSGHQVQGQTVFPAAGYVSTALEAARYLSGGRDISLLEIGDFAIHQAVAFDAEDAGIEVMISLADVTQAHPDRIHCRFTYSAALGSQAQDLTLAASGDLQIRLGEPSKTTLPPRAPLTPHMIDVDASRFYSALAAIGYNFSGRFQSLFSLNRKYGRSTCAVKMQAHEANTEQMLIHPAELDAAFQSIILAYSYPNDDQLRSLHLPTTIGRIRVNPALCGQRSEVEYAPVDATLAPGIPPGQGFGGDVNLYSNECANAAVQVQGVKLVPLGIASINDRRVFSKIFWVEGQPDGQKAACDTVVSQYHVDVSLTLERIMAYYYRKFDSEVPQDSPARSQRPTSCYLDFARHYISLMDNGKHKSAKIEWKKDTLENILQAGKHLEADVPDVAVMHLVGKHMPRVFKGEADMLEQFRLTGVLDDYYAKGFGLRQSCMWIGRTIAQIAERYPHLEILEAGAGTGAATKDILKCLGKNFLSYTFTDISAGFFENAAGVFSKHKDRMLFKVLNAEKNPLDQGYVEGTYDVVIASFVIHATVNLDETLRNLRKLLKPGGFLVVGEGYHDGVYSGTGGFIFGTLPGWWLGVDEGRTIGPYASTKEWDRLLKSTGFSGIDTSPPKAFEELFGVSIFVSQAVNDRVSLLRSPLSAPATEPLDKLVFIGGATEVSSHLIDGVKSLLQPISSEVHVFTTLADTDYSILDTKSTVISLTELDRPVLQDITEEGWVTFKPMFEEGKTMLWVTKGRQTDEPFCNMTVGFGRTAVHETTELHLKFLDFADAHTATPQVIVDVLLRHRATRGLNEDEKAKMLWSIEPEIVIDSRGRELLPRLTPLPILNDRYNSGRHPIVRDTDVTQASVVARREKNGLAIKQLPLNSTTEHKEPVLRIRSMHTTLSAVKTSIGHKFLTLGVDPTTGVKYFALIPSTATIQDIPKAGLVPCPEYKCSEASLLGVVAAHLVSMSVIETLFEGQKVIVHNPSKLIAHAMTTEASRKSVDTVFTTDAASFEKSDSWTALFPYLSDSEIRQIIPKDVACFIGLTNHDLRRSENELAILSAIPQQSRKETLETLFSPEASGSTASGSDSGDTLREAVEHALHTLSEATQTFNLKSVSAQDLVNKVALVDPLAVVDWTDPTLLPVNVTRVDSENLFKSNKTYWMVGLSGALGISLCDWMIDKGATYLVLTSRNPKIDPAWISAHERNGVIVTIIPCDVTNLSGLKAVHENIRTTLPPIAGVLNGAMVLRDVSIRNMSYEQMSDVARPKVYGSIHLDSMFRDVDLDFFILFSSINCIIGNLGQANYAAANTFMCGIAAKRRARGLAATALNVGAIIGAGYMERESNKALDLTVSKMALMHLSEEDFHQLFAEAIKAGRPNSPYGPELSTGLLDIPAHAPNAPRWYSDPKFSPFIIHQSAADTDGGNETAAASIQELLEQCRSPAELLEIIKQTFATQLRIELQMTTEDSDLMAMRSSEIGLDSLISVDIRSWFLKNFRVSIPVLKIMGNDTMENLAAQAAEMVPAELTPNLDSGEGETNAEEKVKVHKKALSVVAADRNGGGDKTDESPTDSKTDSLESTSSASSAFTTPPGEEAIDSKDTVDWEAESQMPASFASLAAATPPDPPPASTPSVIVLTGAAGLLGHNLVQYLLAESSVRKIICVAVRDLEGRLARGELVRSERVVYYEGDLRDARLGLSAEAEREIFAEADAVVHNGADTSHLKYFQAMRVANVESTTYLLSQCLARRVPFHYVSSVGVGLFRGSPTFHEVSATTSSTPPRDGAHGYIASKWTCERLLERTSEAYGLKVWIHRPSTIVRTGSDARTARAQMDWVNSLVTYSRRLRAVPRVEHISGALDLVHVRNVCADVAGAVLGNTPRPPPGALGRGPRVTYVHEVGDVVIPLDEMQWRMRKDGEDNGDKPYKVLPFPQWSAQAIAAGLHQAVAALIESMDTPGDANYMRILKGLPK